MVYVSICILLTTIISYPHGDDQLTDGRYLHLCTHHRLLPSCRASVTLSLLISPHGLFPPRAADPFSTLQTIAHILLRVTRTPHSALIFVSASPASPPHFSWICCASAWPTSLYFRLNPTKYSFAFMSAGRENAAAIITHIIIATHPCEIVFFASHRDATLIIRIISPIILRLGNVPLGIFFYSAAPLQPLLVEPGSAYRISKTWYNSSSVPDPMITVLFGI